MDWDNIRDVRIHARAAEARIAELEAELDEARALLVENSGRCLAQYLDGESPTSTCASIGVPLCWRCRVAAFLARTEAKT